jgi:hypothetical protein
MGEYLKTGYLICGTEKVKSCNIMQKRIYSYAEISKEDISVHIRGICRWYWPEKTV